MKLGTRLTHPVHGPVEVKSLTAAMVCYRVLGTNETHYEKRVEFHKWRVGGRCWIVPDDELPDARCRGTIVSLTEDKRPKEVRIDDGDPVWNGAVIEATGAKYGRIGEC